MFLRSIFLWNVYGTMAENIEEADFSTIQALSVPVKCKLQQKR